MDRRFDPGPPGPDRRDSFGDKFDQGRETGPNDGERTGEVSGVVPPQFVSTIEDRAHGELAVGGVAGEDVGSARSVVG